MRLLNNLIFCIFNFTSLQKMSGNSQNITLKKGLVSILIAGIISIVLAMSVDMTGYEMGALFNLYIPPFVMTLSIIIFLFTCRLSKNDWIRFLILASLCFYLLYVGTAFYKEKEVWPLLIR